MKKNLLSLLLSLLCLTAMQAQDLQARQPAPEQTSTHPSMHGNLSPDMRYRDYKRLYNPKDYVRMPGDRHSPAVSGVCSWLIPGLGQMICGEVGRGFGYLGGAVACGAAVGTGYGLLFAA